MPIFKKGTIFTMGGKEFEVVAEGNADPSSCLLYVPRHEKETADPLSIRLWKAEAKLARGDIMINGAENEEAGRTASFYPPIADPLEQIAELKKRIQEIEERRVFLLKSNDPGGQFLLQDNMIRPNRSFDIWTFAAGGANAKRPVQYLRPRALVMAISANDIPEHFLFNITGQMPPCCRTLGDTLSADGQITLNLERNLKTIQGTPTDILNTRFQGRIELEVELKLRCKYETGQLNISSQILKCSYIREVNAPALKIGNLTFPEIGEHLIAILGVNVDIYTAAPKREVKPLVLPEFL